MKKVLGGQVKMVGIFPGLRQGTVVPDVAVAGEGVGHIPKPSALLVIVLEFNFRGSLYREKDTTLYVASARMYTPLFLLLIPLERKKKSNKKNQINRLQNLE